MTIPWGPEGGAPSPAGPRVQPPRASRAAWPAFLTVFAFSAAVYLACIVSPPSLMDDVDAVQAQIARNMLESGDWVTARLDGIPYLEKAPLVYWVIAGSYKVFGVHDWAARIPVALSAIGLCCVTAAFGMWAFGSRAGTWAGLCLATCVGLWLFTRILIPDVMLTLTVALAMWALLRALDEDERRPALWASLLAASLGMGLLLKSLIGVVFPVATAAVYLGVTRQLFTPRTWARLHPFRGALIVLAIAAPWHLLAMLRNPPYFEFTLRSVPGEYHGFLWFFFINEQLLRFLNLRYPRDYSTVPRLYFWLFHLVWLFPWSVYLPAVVKLSYRPADRAGRTRLLALCWIGVVLVFFTFSTTQEYYSMPAYPAFALLLGSAMALSDDPWIARGTRIVAGTFGVATVLVVAMLIAIRNVPAPGDISQALSRQATYKLSLSHMLDLTLPSFAYLRLPLYAVVPAFGGAAVAALIWRGERAFPGIAIGMVLFFQAARLAMVQFDPYLSSRPLAETLSRSPEGALIVYHHYYPFSSVFFYTNRSALLLDGRAFNLMYGSYAPGAPDVFIDDQRLRQLWLAVQRYYLAVPDTYLAHLRQLLGEPQLVVVTASGGKSMLTNHPLPRN